MYMQNLGQRNDVGQKVEKLLSNMCQNNGPKVYQKTVKYPCYNICTVCIPNKVDILSLLFIGQQISSSEGRKNNVQSFLGLYNFFCSISSLVVKIN